MISDGLAVVTVGVGATLIMDAWSMLIKKLGFPTLDYALVGRWAFYLLRGKLVHDSINKTAPVLGESPLGWSIHYAVGIVFALALACIQGMEWFKNPTLLPAMLIGVVTVVFPLFIMQPAMGVGFAASRTPHPIKSCLLSLAAHTIFGIGLYVTAVLITALLFA